MAVWLLVSSPRHQCPSSTQGYQTADVYLTYVLNESGMLLRGQLGWVSGFVGFVFFLSFALSFLLSFFLSFFLSFSLSFLLSFFLSVLACLFYFALFVGVFFFFFFCLFVCFVLFLCLPFVWVLYFSQTTNTGGFGRLSCTLQVRGISVRHLLKGIRQRTCT